jgi:hypothetical protein
MEYNRTVGSYTPEMDEKPASVDRDFYGQGRIFKNWRAFYENPDDVCYAPELSDACYTKNDFLSMCVGNAELAEELFLSVDWQHPESLLQEWYAHEEIADCPECGYAYNLYNVRDDGNPVVCERCGAKIGGAA